jgi:hypothetical protein
MSAPDPKISSLSNEPLHLDRQPLKILVRLTNRKMDVRKDGRINYALSRSEKDPMASRVKHKT